GDEFGVLLPRHDLTGAQRLAKRLIDSVERETAAIRDRDLRTTASIGIVLYPEHGRETDDLLTRADLAMYQAKGQGRGRFEVFDRAEHLEPFMARTETAERIRACLEQDRMELHLEPICDLRTGELCRYETLLRMPDLNDKLLSPADFLGIADRFGLSRDIDRWVVGRAFELLRTFQDKGFSIPLEVNLSGAAFNDQAVLDRIENEVRSGAVPPGSLVFEITEKEAISEMRRARNFIEELRRLGCDFAIDDFGAGFSSFRHLRHLPVRYLKIDGSFVRSIHRDPVNQNLVRAIVEMARSLGTTPIAEFVDSADTAAWLCANGCVFGQGEYLALAQPPEVVLEEHRKNLSGRSVPSWGVPVSIA
ncbi:MAG: bifunctional diguanylate cyclase/phosphodiesterase, partial [Thermoanaerobaculia bacterium]|nr:bifunctional diguanylate cyclase/phosphodiesterase [Thermoanaerobaculia bacterium]